MAGQAVHIGILAEKPDPEQRLRWQALADYLAAAQPAWEVSLQVLPLDELDLAINHHRLHFVLTEPAHYTRLQHKSSNARALATVVRHVDNQSVSALAGTIITSASNHDITDVRSLKGKTIAVIGRDNLASYQAQLEMLVKAGIAVPEQTTLVQVEPWDEAVVRAVLARRAAAGFVRAGVLEDMAAAGELALEDVRVIHPQLLPGYPYAVSTRLYPEWPFVALPTASPDVARKITALLMSIENEGELATALTIYGFTPPASYLAVTELARELRLAQDIGNTFVGGGQTFRLRQLAEIIHGSHTAVEINPISPRQARTLQVIHETRPSQPSTP